MKKRAAGGIASVSLFLFLLNLLAGLLFINEGLFHHDSVLLAKAVEDTYATGHLHPAARGRYGSVAVNCVLHAPFFLLGHNADFTTRFSSVFFHSLSAVMLAVLIYALLGTVPGALFGGLLLSFTPFYFSPNTWGKEHGLFIFSVLLSFYLLHRGTEKDNGLWLGLSGMTMAFSVSVRESALVILPLYFLFYLSPRIAIRPPEISIRKERLGAGPLLRLILPMTAILAVIYFTYLRAEFYREMVLRDNTSAIFLGPLSPMLRIAIKDLGTCIPPVLFLFFVLGIVRLFSREDVFLPLFLILWAALIFYFGNIETFTLRYLDIVIIPVYIGVAYYMSELRVKERLAADAIMAYFVISMFVMMHPMLEFRHSYNGEKRYALFVRDNTPADAVIITMDDSAFIEYYAGRKTVTHPIDDIRKTADFVKEMKGYLAKGVPLYMTGSALSYDHKKIFSRIFDANFYVHLVGSRLSEDYHRPEIRFFRYKQGLFKVTPKRALDIP
ncbi:MAG: glycosyltransferase family 39 protein [Candidatus Omnitrophota bacterium]